MVFFRRKQLSARNLLFLPLMYTDTRKAGLTDELTASIHYGEVSHMITKFRKEHTYKLLEATVQKISAKCCFKSFRFSK